MTSVAIGASIATLTFLIYWLVTKKTTSKRELILVGLVTVIVGLSADFIFGKHLGMWTYIHHTYGSASYWLLLPPAWFFWGLWVRLTWKLVSHILYKTPRWALAVTVTITTAGISEYLGYARNCWAYNSPLWLLALGWLLMIWFMTMFTDSILEGSHVRAFMGLRFDAQPSSRS